MARESVPSRKVAIINKLTHTKGPFAGQPFRLRRWQERDIIRPLFTINKATGRRQYRTCLLMMPRKNGIEVLEWLRHREEYKDLPVVMVTSSNHDGDQSNAAAHGIEAYRVKPVSFKELVKLAAD